MCRRITSVEWSGRLFYTVEGDITQPDTLVIHLKDIYLMDIGQQTHTQFNNDEENIIDMYNEHPEYMSYRMGYIHSHNSMSVFFSGEDVDELRVNSKGCDYYLSVITNNAREYVAAIALNQVIKVHEETTRVVTPGPFSELLTEYSKKTLKTTEEDQLITFELNVEVDRSGETETWADQQITRVTEHAKKRVVTYRSDYWKHISSHNWERPTTGWKDRVPHHVSPNQLDAFSGQPVSKTLRYSMTDIICELLAPNQGFTAVQDALSYASNTVANKEFSIWAEQKVSPEEVAMAFFAVSSEDINLNIYRSILDYLADMTPGGWKIAKVLRKIARKALGDYEKRFSETVESVRALQDDVDVHFSNTGMRPSNWQAPDNHYPYAD